MTTQTTKTKKGNNMKNLCKNRERLNCTWDCDKTDPKKCYKLYCDVVDNKNRPPELVLEDIIGKER